MQFTVTYVNIIQILEHRFENRLTVQHISGHRLA